MNFIPVTGSSQWPGASFESMLKLTSENCRASGRALCTQLETEGTFYRKQALKFVKKGTVLLSPHI